MLYVVLESGLWLHMMCARVPPSFDPRFYHSSEYPSQCLGDNVQQFVYNRSSFREVDNDNIVAVL